MKITIQKNGVQRDLQFPFKICGSRRALLELAKQICSEMRGGPEVFDDHGDIRFTTRSDFSFGWVDIVEPVNTEKVISKTQYIEWGDGFEKQETEKKD